VVLPLLLRLLQPHVLLQKLHRVGVLESILAISFGPKFMAEIKRFNLFLQFLIFLIHSTNYTQLQSDLS
jgi:hypothetical protein